MGGEIEVLMSFFYVINGRKVKQYFLIMVAALFTVGIIYIEKDNITVFSLNEPSAVYSVPTNKKVIALTFDISWGEKRAEPILNVLMDKKVTNATFFLSSPWAKSHPDLVKKMADAGFEIGSHGHKHDNYSTFNEEDIRKQIQTAHAVLSEMTGTKPNLIRLPNGDFDKRVLRIANELNYTVIQWDTDSLDWKNPGVDQIVNRVVSKAHPGDIVLLHASDSSQQTHQALPVIIDKLRADGYEFVTVTQLLQQVETKHTPVEDGTA